MFIAGIHFDTDFETILFIILCIIAFFVFSFVMPIVLLRCGSKIITKFCYKKIQKAKSLKEANRIRSMYKALIYSLCTFCLIFFSVLIIADPFGTICIIYIIYYAFYKCQYRPIYSYDKNKCKGKKFSLYLRGFSTDSYEPSWHKLYNNESTWLFRKFPNLLYTVFCYDIISDKDKTIEPVNRNKVVLFNESNFCLNKPKGIDLYSIGMTKELFAPKGTKRIYLDEMTWQSDVKDLMQQSQFNFILLNNRINCLKEIHFASELPLEKNIFIADDYSEYINVTKHIKASKSIGSELRNFPTNLREDDLPCFIYYRDKWVIEKFVNVEPLFGRCVRSLFRNIMSRQ